MRLFRISRKRYFFTRANHLYNCILVLLLCKCFAKKYPKHIDAMRVFVSQNARQTFFSIGSGTVSMLIVRMAEVREFLTCTIDKRYENPLNLNLSVFKLEKFKMEGHAKILPFIALLSADDEEVAAPPPALATATSVTLTFLFKLRIV